MFKIGDKVRNTKLGVGIVISIMDGVSYPLRVRYIESGRVHGYTMLGHYWSDIDKDVVRDLQNIRAKVGSPDARKIVALLLREIRRDRRQYNYWKNTTSNKKDKALGSMERVGYLYKQAKQLLGKDDEN